MNRLRIFALAALVVVSLTCAALRADTESAEAWLNKGLALYSLKRYAEARQALEKAAELGLAQARQALEALRQEGH
jgi:tetratricopeptide (TPR) repeat protein